MDMPCVEHCLLILPRFDFERGTKWKVGAAYAVSLTATVQGVIERLAWFRVSAKRPATAGSE